jgi:hypothetical protein
MKINHTVEHTIIGNIFPAKKDRDGKVIQVLIDSSDRDQDTYFIEKNKIGNELLALINHKVQVTGFVKENHNGDLIFDVKDFKTLSDSGEVTTDNIDE